MKKVMRNCILATALALCGITEAAVTISDALHTAFVTDGVHDDVLVTNSDTAIPLVTDVTADLRDVSGGTVLDGYAITDLERSETIFDYFVTQSRPASTGDSVAGNDGYDRFTVDVATYFTIYGEYQLYGISDVDVQIRLTNVDSSQDIFTFATYDAGDGYLAWSESGLLQPGNYEYYYGMSIVAYGADEAATAMGNAVLEIPEPATIAVLSLGGLLLRRKK